MSFKVKQIFFFFLKIKQKESKVGFTEKGVGFAELWGRGCI